MVKRKRNKKRMGTCDSCGKHRKTRRLELGGGSGISLCDSCLRREIAWRKQRNKTLRGKAKFRTKYKF